jgi:hypothetical protein
LALRANTQFAFLLAKNSGLRCLWTQLIASQLGNGSVKIGSGDMRADLVKHGKLTFEPSQNGGHTGIARRSRCDIFHSQIPSWREPFSAGPHNSCVAAETGGLSC